MQHGIIAPSQKYDEDTHMSQASQNCARKILLFAELHEHVKCTEVVKVITLKHVSNYPKLRLSLNTWKHDASKPSPRSDF